MQNRTIPIGVFDSGVGGLSVLKAIRAAMPCQPVIYFADQEHVPYGPRPLEQVDEFTHAITRWLLEQGAELIVVACNSASAASLQNLRRDFSGTPFVGMEPAVKPAAEQTSSGVVGVLATPATFQGALYASVVERFAQGVVVLQDVCPGLVAQIEAGQLDSPATRAILEKAIQPMLAQGIDTIVLGCTHYPFVIPLVREIAGPGVRVIDPAPAVARQVHRLLQAHGWLCEDAGPGMPQQPGWVRYFTSGSPQAFTNLLPRLLGDSFGGGEPCVEIHRI